DPVRDSLVSEGLFEVVLFEEAAQVAAPKGVTGIALFEVSPHPLVLVAQGEEGLGDPASPGVEPLFHDLPGMCRDKSVWGFCHSRVSGSLRAARPLPVSLSSLSS